MSYAWESGAVGPVGATPYPLLLECDEGGGVVWMSAAARMVLGEPRNVVDALRLRLAAAGDTPGQRSLSLSLMQLMETGERLLLIGHVERSFWSQPRPEQLPLPMLELRLTRHYFRLQEAERRLSRRVRRGGGGRQAILHIERERQRLGRELHTGVGQMLAAIQLQLELVSATEPQQTPPVQNALARISTLAGDALGQVRSISKRLHPPEWQRLPLDAALRQLWDLSGIPQRYEAQLEIGPLPTEPDLEVKVLIYRAAQEALSNFTQHARATRIDMRLKHEAGQFILEVQDNGVGFDVNRLASAPPSVASGLGLRSIREQAEALNGKLIIESGPAGTRLEVTVPSS